MGTIDAGNNAHVAGHFFFFFKRNGKMKSNQPGRQI